jgi:hypothetical protein
VYVLPTLFVTLYKVVEPAHTAKSPVIGGVVGVLLTATVCKSLPVPQPVVSVKPTSPPVAPKFTVIVFVPCPLAMVAPAGTVQAYVEPVELTLYVIAVALGQTAAGPTITGVI